MVRYIISGLLTGIVLGIVVPFNISLLNEKVLLLLILVGIDVIFSGINAKLLKQFEYLLFTNEFILNSILSVGLIYLGNIMGLDLFSAVSLVLIFKVFYNLNKLIKTIVCTLKNKNSLV
ncbi:MAG: DUF1290 domain-containing protein [bacterium]|nr:DUF1290 domain-containing protein [bacterium]